MPFRLLFCYSKEWKKVSSAMPEIFSAGALSNNPLHLSVAVRKSNVKNVKNSQAKQYIAYRKREAFAGVLPRIPPASRNRSIAR
jgi:hypothetical protein